MFPSISSAAIVSHFKSKRDDLTRRKNKTLENHRAQNKKLGRKKRVSGKLRCSNMQCKDSKVLRYHNETWEAY